MPVGLGVAGMGVAEMGVAEMGVPVGLGNLLARVLQTQR